ncbi:lytic transglycosylase domain-containing protein [Yoonia sp. SS1-5]|uniref:Lytic transglycosylase domain-containing protein n=1 Tax=Yoonia rhodophyticola TaxID=3137370 RepID=A0AAN0NJT2_9RHOB
MRFLRNLGIGIVVLSASSAPAQEQVSTMSRSALFQSQLDVLDGRASQQYSNSVRLQPPRIEVPGAPGSTPAYTGSYRGPYLAVARDAARRNRVPEDLFFRLVQQESGWNPVARSVKGAMGLAQLMPQTARLLGVDPSDAAQNLEGGARYLRQQYEKFGTWRLALAAYNAGPGAVERFNGVPPYRETQNYVRIIWGE